MPTLAEVLDHTPRPLAFGTSGRRGLVQDLTQLEVFINVRAELEYLLSRPRSAGGLEHGGEFFIAHDLRPSSTAFVPSQGGRGELAQAVMAAVEDAGLRPVNIGALPTPALTAHALARRAGSIMVTGSHIPFERNGYKTNSAEGELLKTDEAPIAEYVARWRQRLLATDATLSAFAPDGRLKTGSRPLPPAEPAGSQSYLRRYLDFFGDAALRGLRVLVYQHSAVGRDLLVETLRALGAEATPVARSETFVPIDTEALDDSTLDELTALAVAASGGSSRFDALVSTDGDSDRPLILGLRYDDSGRPTARFHGGDLVGMVVAAALGADRVVVPVSCNDAIDRGPLAALLEPKTRIGSPYVIAGMLAARARGARRVCGWEANGGFLTGSDIERDGRVLPALPTRDAFLPIITVLREALARRCPVDALFDALPRRYSRAGLLRPCPRSAGLAAAAALLPRDGEPQAEFAGRVARYFTPEDGFPAVVSVNGTDGTRLGFANRDVAHVRPSGNADELRIYAVADSQARADAIVASALRPKDGVLTRLLSEI